jgi:hypothetical protein
MRHVLRPLLLLALVLSLVVPASATEHEADELDEPTLRTERTYFSCGDVNKVRLVNGLQGDYDTWDTEEPTTSFTAGGGCGTSSTLFADPELNGTWEGTFTGNLDSIAVEIHIIDVGISRLDEPYAVVPTLEIDGQVRHLQLEEYDLIELETTRSDTNLTVKGLMTITGLGLLTEPGDGETERTVRLTLTGTELDSGAFVWDAVEVPSGLTFNPETIEGKRVRAF